MHKTDTPERVASTDELALPLIDDEDRQFLHYNPNTSEVVEWVQEYAARAVVAERKRCAQSCKEVAAQMCGVYGDDAECIATGDACAVAILGTADTSEPGLT